MSWFLIIVYITIFYYIIMYCVCRWGYHLDKAYRQRNCEWQAAEQKRTIDFWFLAWIVPVLGIPFVMIGYFVFITDFYKESLTKKNFFGDKTK